MKTQVIWEVKDKRGKFYGFVKESSRYLAEDILEDYPGCSLGNMF